MNTGDTAAAKTISRLFDLPQWPEDGLRNYPLLTGETFVWLDYEPENESLKLEAGLAGTPEGFDSRWLEILMAASGPDQSRDDSWLGLRDGHITLRTVCFPAQLTPDELMAKLNAFSAAALAWRELLAGNLAGPPEKVFGPMG